jgi:cytochrome b561
MVSALPQAWDRPLIALHWAMALLIFGLHALGMCVDLFDNPSVNSSSTCTRESMAFSPMS